MRTWEAEQYADAYLSRLEDRIADVYNAALKKAIQNCKGFFKELNILLSARDRQISSGMDTKNVDKDIQYKISQLMREQNLIGAIADELKAAGQEIVPEVQNAMADIYLINGNATRDELGEASGVRFSNLRKDQARIILDDEMPVMSRIAYNNIREQPEIIRKLQNEMAQAAALGESQKKIIQRIRKITGMSAYQAKRVAQTERTRVQSQARYQAGQQAQNAGVRVCNTWDCRFRNSREAHMDRNGKVALQGDAFLGSVMRYPGDPAGGAKEVINCHCVLVPDVLGDDEDVVDGRRIKRAG